MSKVLLSVLLMGILLSVTAIPLGPAAGAVAKKVATAAITGISFASLDAGLSSLSAKAPPPAPPTPAPQPFNNGGPDIMIIIVGTTGASVVIVFIFLLILSLVRVLTTKQNANINE